MRRIAATVAVLALVPVAAAQAQASTGTHPSTAPTHQAAKLHGPPPVHLASDVVDLGVRPYASCWSGRHSGVCYDGPPPNPLPSLGGVIGGVTLAFARDDWTFSVSVLDDSGHRTKIRLVPNGPQEWRLGIAKLPNGAYRVDIFGKGPQGDVLAAAAFTLT